MAKREVSTEIHWTFKILERIGLVTYLLALPPDISQVHPVFHVSMLRKYISSPSYVLQSHSVEVNEDLTYEEEPVAIVNFQVLQLSSKTIPLVKVLWRNNMSRIILEKPKLRCAQRVLIFFLNDSCYPRSP